MSGQWVGENLHMHSNCQFPSKVLETFEETSGETKQWIRKRWVRKQTAEQHTEQPSPKLACSVRREANGEGAAEDGA